MAEFVITRNGKTVGNAIMERQGLYYRFHCQCVLPDRDIHTIWVRWGEGSRKLGICVPNGPYFCLDTKVPIKYIPNTGLLFEVDYKENPPENFYPIDTEQPFIHTDKLAKARFATREGQPGLIIPM